MFDDITLFVHIVQRQSLSSAADYLNLPAATVTRRLQKLEATLDCQLIYRSARKFHLTTEGEIYYQAYAGLIQELEQTTRNLSADMRDLSGKLKVFAPTNISVGILQPMWSAFIRANPNIKLELLLNNQTEDLLSAQIDLALRIGPQIDSQLYQKRLGAISTLMVAAPKYLSQHGIPKNLVDLHQHHLIVASNLPIWKLFNREANKSESIHPVATTFVNDIGLANQFAIDGIGIALLPYSEVIDGLQQSQLNRVLPHWEGPQREIFAVWPSGRLLNAKAKCLRDFIQQFIAKTPVLQGAL